MTDHPAIDAHPSWSPDSKWISFDTTRQGKREGYAVTRDGCAERNLTLHPAEDGTPSWHPRERKVIFSSDRSGEEQLFEARLRRGEDNGLDLSSLRHFPTGARSYAPQWSPDGKTLLFESRRDGNRELYVKRRSAEPENLTRHPGADFFGRWSPDGASVAFWSTRAGSPDLYIVGADGKGLRRLTQDASSERMPAWSPDGRFLVYTSDKTGAYELYVLDLATGNARRLTCDWQSCGLPAS